LAHAVAPQPYLLQGGIWVCSAPTQANGPVKR